jgi:hypothetical protein
MISDWNKELFWLRIIILFLILFNKDKASYMIFIFLQLDIYITY